MQNIFLNFLNGWYHNCCCYWMWFSVANFGYFSKLKKCSFHFFFRLFPDEKAFFWIQQWHFLKMARVGNTALCDYLFQQNNIWTWILRSHCSQAVNSPALCPWVVNRKHISSYSDTFFCVSELVIAAHIFNNDEEF